MEKLHFIKPRISTSSAFGISIRRMLEVVLRGKPKLVKPKFFLWLPIALLSLEIYLGAILGYFLTKFFTAKTPSIVLNIGRWRFHFHHWLYGLAILISAFHFNFLPFPQFSFGFLGGMVFQGIYCHSDWHQVLMKRY